MTTIREYAVTILFALAALIVAGYYFQQLLVTTVEQAVRFPR